MFLLQMERRIDPWLRPAFDAMLRDPIARLVTALINKQRQDEGLKIAEEKPLPNEEEFLNSIIADFPTQMRGLWKPGGIRARRQHQDARHRARRVYRPRQSSAGVSSRHLCQTADVPLSGCAFPDRVLTSRRTSTTSAS